MPTKKGSNQDYPLHLFLADEPEEQAVETWDRAVISSPTKDSYNQNHPLPLVLADEVERQGIGKAWDATVISSRILKASILGATATAIFVAILWVGNPATLFADFTASLVDKSALQPGTDQSTPTIQSTADAEALPPTAKDTPTRDEMAAVTERAN